MTEQPPEVSADRRLKVICERVRDSDRDAFRDLFEELYPPLLRYANSILRDLDGSKDVVQEVFFRLWNRRTTLDANRSVKSLLYTAVRNLAFNTERTASTRKMLLTTLESNNIAPDVSDGIDARLLQERLKEWIGQMPDRRREAFQLSRYDGLSYAEIGKMMDLSVRTVERHIQLALRHLRARLKEYEPSLLLP